MVKNMAAKNYYNEQRRLLKVRQLYLLTAVLVVWAAYVLLNISESLGVLKDDFNTGLGKGLVILLSIDALLLIIWLAAAFGSFWVFWYSQSIKDRLESHAWLKIAQGLVVFTVSIIASGYISLLERLDILNQSQRVIVSNLSTVFLSLVAYTLIFLGTRELLRRINSKDSLGKIRQLASLALIVAIIVYVYAVFTNEYRLAAEDPKIVPTYYLSDPLILILITIPTAISWIVGVMAAINLAAYKLAATGLIYKKALKNLYVGVLSLIIFSVALQYVRQLVSSLLNLRLSQVLLLVYVILIVYVVAYSFIVSGAKKLLKIEQV